MISADEERVLLQRFERLRWEPIEFHGRETRRSARHFGLDYDHGARTPRPGEPVPDWLEPPRRVAASSDRRDIVVGVSITRFGRFFPAERLPG